MNDEMQQGLDRLGEIIAGVEARRGKELANILRSGAVVAGHLRSAVPAFGSLEEATAFAHCQSRAASACFHLVSLSIGDRMTKEEIVKEILMLAKAAYGD